MKKLLSTLLSVIMIASCVMFAMIPANAAEGCFQTNQTQIKYDAYGAVLEVTDVLFNDNGDALSSITYSDLEKTQPLTKVEYSYSNDNLDVLITRYAYSVNKWVKEYESFDCYIMIDGVHILKDYWNKQYDQAGNVTDGYKSIYEYDEKGNETESESYIWNNSDWELTYAYKNDITYGDNGKVKTILCAEYDFLTSDWGEYLQKYEYTYPEKNKCIFIFYEYDSINEVWFETNRTTSVEDEFGNNIFSLSEYYDWLLEEWVATSKIESVYDGEKELQSVYYYLDDNSNLTEYQKNTCSYNADGYIIEMTSLYYNFGTKAYDSGYKITYELDEENKLSKGYYYSFDGSTYTLDDYFENYHSETIHKDPVKIDGLKPTNTAPGYKDYYKCSCGYFYEDENCTVKIENIDAWKSYGGRGYLGISAETGDFNGFSVLIPVMAITFAVSCGLALCELKKRKA